MCSRHEQLPHVIGIGPHGARYHGRHGKHRLYAYQMAGCFIPYLVLSSACSWSFYEWRIRIIQRNFILHCERKLMATMSFLRWPLPWRNGVKHQCWTYTQSDSPGNSTDAASVCLGPAVRRPIDLFKFYWHVGVLWFISNQSSGWLWEGLPQRWRSFRTNILNPTHVGFWSCQYNIFFSYRIGFFSWML